MEKIELNKEYIVDIIDEDNIGHGIAKLNNYVIFVLYALKDEKVNIKIESINSRYATASIVKIIKKSSKRVDEICKCFNDCGSCSYLNIDYNDENNKKINEVNKLLNLNIKEIKTNNEYYYRNKAIFHINNNKIGYYKEKTNNIIEFNECLLLDKRINSIYKYFKSQNLNNIDSILIRTSKEEIMVKLDSKLSYYDYNDLINKFKIDSLYLNDKLLYGKEYIIETINNYSFSIYPESFFQINRENMIIMYDTIKEYAGNGNNLLDLYCGTGTIGIYLNKNYNTVTGIEINESSIENANINKKLNNLDNINFILGDASIASKKEYDTIIIDPPRVGVSKKVINYLNTSNSNNIIYVSCNPNTLKRDLELLTNYKIDKITLINMFNKTKHIECVVKLIKKISY